MEEIFKKAIEGGYTEGGKWQFIRANRYWVEWLDGNGTPTTIRVELYFLDPLFWQSLGKACGWGNNISIEEAEMEKVIGRKMSYHWLNPALRFHEENLVNGWDSAIEYLSKITRGTALVN